MLLFGYRHVPDSAKLTYQVIDSFDWSDGAGLRKGFAYPSLGRLAEIRGVDERTIRRHLVQLEQASLISRKERPGRPSLLVIEDPSAVETQRYMQTFGGVGEDRSVRPTPDKNVRPLLQEDKERRIQSPLTRLEKPSGVGEGRGSTDPMPVGDFVRERVGWLKMNGEKIRSPTVAKREHLVQQMIDVLGDEHSRGYYRKVAGQFSPDDISQALGLVDELAQAGKIRESRGALFVETIGGQRKGRA